MIAVLLTITFCAWAAGESVLVGCPNGCDVMVASADPFPHLVRTLRASAEGHAVSGLDLRIAGESGLLASAVNGSWAKVFVPPTLSANVLVALKSTASARVIVLADGSSMLSGSVADITVPSHVLGAIAAAAACAGPSPAVAFIADAADDTTRGMRKAFNAELFRLCPARRIVGDLFAGTAPTDDVLSALDEASTVVTFGTAAEELAEQILNQTTAARILPLRFAERSNTNRAAVSLDVGRYVVELTYTEQAIPDPFSFATVGSCVPHCGSLSSAGHSSSPEFVAATARQQDGDIPASASELAIEVNRSTLMAGITIRTIPQLASSLPGNTVLGGSVALWKGSTVYVVPYVSSAYVFDPVTLSVDIARRAADLEVPRGAAIAQWNGTAIAQGGTLSGADYTSAQTVISVGDDGVIRSQTTPTVGCPAATGHSAVPFEGIGIILYGGLSTALEPIGSVSVLNVTSATCSAISDDIDRPANSRYRHSAVSWNGDKTIGGVHDDLWMIVAGGTSTSVEPDAASKVPLVAFAVNRRRWVPLTAPDRVLVFARPSLIPFADHLFVVGTTLEAFSVGRASWNEASLGPAVPEVLVGPVVPSSSSDAVVRGSVARGSDGVPSFGVVLISSPSCAGTSVPSAGLTDCQPCSAGTVREDSRCVACAPRHIVPSASYEEKSACWDGWEWQGIMAIVFLMLVIIAISPLVSVFLYLVQRSDKARRNQIAAVQLSEAIASMKLERVSFLSNITDPTRVERALSCCVKSLKVFRQAMPDAALRVADSCNQRPSDRLDEFDGTATQLDAWSEAEGTDNGTVRDPGVLSRRSSMTRGSTTFPFVDQHRSQMTLSGTGARLGDDLADYMLYELRCELRAMPTAVAVFTIDGLPKWSDAQRPKALPSRLAKIYDSVTHAIQRTSGVTDAVVGDRIIASWNEEVHDSPLTAACTAAYHAAHSTTLDQMGVNLHVGVSFGEVRSGFVGCEGQDAPPFRQHTVFGPVATEAVNLSHAASMLRLAVLTPWAFNDVLQNTFIVRFVCGLRFGNIVTRPLFVGEILGLQADAELVWDQGKLAEHVRRFNDAMLKRVLEHGNASDAARMFEGLPQRYVHALQHALVSKQLPLETVPRAWW